MKFNVQEVISSDSLHKNIDFIHSLDAKMSLEGEETRDSRTELPKQFDLLETSNTKNFS